MANIWIPRDLRQIHLPSRGSYGVFGRFALWRVGKSRAECRNCELCQVNCEGACEPGGHIRIHECVLCMNCLYDCQHNLMAYAPQPSAAGEINSPDVSRRGFLITFLAGAAAVPILRLEGQVGPNCTSGLIRPPGSLPEEAFLTRCLKCGQCMRICPTKIIQPALFEGGFEAIWTPVLDF